jgi:post-segregation antitoxin (ccd killing protein)
MSQFAQEVSRPERVHLGAMVDPEQRRQLVELARQEDCSVSRIVRKALAAELERIESRRS